MKFTQSRLKLILTIIFCLSIILGGINRIEAQTQKKDSLTLEMLITGLKSTSSGMSLADKNVFIELRVNKLGVDFPLSAKIEKDLRNAGAIDSLIATIRQKAPKIVDEKKREEARLRREKREQEIKEYTKNIESNPKDADSYKKRAALYEYNAEDRLALEDYIRALELDPNDQTTKYFLNRIVNDIGKYLYTPVRRERDPVFKKDAYVIGYISAGNNGRREQMLTPPFYRSDGDKSFGDRKEQVHILAFINKDGRVVSATEISNKFWLADEAIQAAKRSSFMAKKSSSDNSTNDWVIITYEFER